MGRYAMIRQKFHIRSYWKVIVYYNVDYDFFDVIEKDLREAGAKNKIIEELYNNMHLGKAKGVTFSNEKLYTSIVLFNRHLNKNDYVNTVVHEGEHIKQSILSAYHITDKGEDAAYTIGYIVMRMFSVVKHLM